MQTIEEYKAYTRQLEGEVAKWHNAYDALMIERNDLVKKVTHLEGEIFKAPKQPRDAEIDTLTTALKTCSEELEELRKHEVQWDLDKARIKELETEKSIASQMCADMALKIAALETELEQKGN